MLVNDLETVIMGSDQTQVMRKHKELIPAHLDNCCLSIIGKNRTLDLMHQQDLQIAKLWEKKIRELIEKDSEHKIIRSPESPQLRQECDFYTRDQLAPCFEYIWKIEILNNWQKYWNTLDKTINMNQDIVF